MYNRLKFGGKISYYEFTMKIIHKEVLAMYRMLKAKYTLKAKYADSQGLPVPLQEGTLVSRRQVLFKNNNSICGLLTSDNIEFIYLL